MFGGVVVFGVLGVFFWVVCVLGGFFCGEKWVFFFEVFFV